MANFVMPQTQTLLSFADPFTTPDWTDISPLAEGFSGQVRGRQHELDQFEAGQIALKLNNQDGRFSRWNTNSPYYNLLSGPDADCQNVSTQPNPAPYGPLQSVASNGQSTIGLSLPQNSGGYLVLLAVMISGDITVSSVSGPSGLTWVSLTAETGSEVSVAIWGAYVDTQAAVSGNITVTYSGSVTSINCELSYQVFTGGGTLTAWTLQTSAGSDGISSVADFPSLSSTTPSIYFGAAWSAGRGTRTPASGVWVNGFAPNLTADSNLVVYNPALVAGVAQDPSYELSAAYLWQAVAVMLSPNGFTWDYQTNCNAVPVLLPPSLWTGQPTNGNGNSGPYGLELTSVAAGTMLAQTYPGAYPVNPSTGYQAMVSFAPGSSTRNVKASIEWYDSSLSFISTSTGSVVAEVADDWVKATVAATSPSNAAYAQLGAYVDSTGAANEVHYIQRAALFKTVASVPNTAWAPGQRSMVPTRSLWIKPTWDAETYDTFRGYVDSWTPIYTGVRSEITVACSDALALLAAANMDSSLYAQQVVLYGATGFWRCNDPGTPTYLADLSQNNIFGSAQVSGTITTGEPGPVVSDPSDAAIDFAAGGYASIPVSPVEGGTWSIAAWFQTTSTATGAVFRQSSGEASIVVTAGGGGAQVVVRLDGGSVLSQTFSTLINDGNWHLIVFTFSGGTAWTASLDSTVETHSGTVSSYSLPEDSATISASGSAFPGNLSDISVFPIALSAAQVATLYGLATAGSYGGFTGAVIENILLNAGWPSSSMDIATGIGDVLPPAAASGTSITETNLLSYIQQVEQAEQGAFYADGTGEFIFRDRWYTATASLATVSAVTLASDTDSAHLHFSAVVPASDNTDIWNDVTAQTQTDGSLPQSAQDPASIARYGRRSLTGYTSLPYIYDQSAAGEADVLVGAYAEPLPRIRSIVLDNTSNSGANLPYMLGLDILTLITVIWQPVDGSDSPLVQNYLIESVKHEVTPGKWKTTWGLSLPYTWLTWSQ